MRATLQENINLDLLSYDYYIVSFSGGKDSLACLIWLLEQGVDKSKIELWHNLVDGKEGSSLMDWPVTEDYCKKVGEHFGIPVYFSWKEGGFEREMNRDGYPTAQNWFETPGGTIASGGSGSPGTRKKFPQVTANLNQRWCSAYLKIDVCSMAIRNQDRFKGKKTLLLSGERAEESAARAKYKYAEPDRTTTKSRIVNRIRPVLRMKEDAIWDMINQYNIHPHPCYYLNISRCSCRLCIFMDADQAATLRDLDPEGFEKVAKEERNFGLTIKRNKSLDELADKGTVMDYNKSMAELAMSDSFDKDIHMDPWLLPSGAFGNSNGPI